MSTTNFAASSVLPSAGAWQEPLPPRAVADAAADLPVITDPGAVSPADARLLSKTLFARLREAEEGTAEYSYIRGTLIELNMALVKFAAGRYRARSEPMEDIVQVGTIGLIKAIDRFDPGYDVEFSTFALPTITGEIKRFFRDTGWMVHVPRRLQELRLALARAEDELGRGLDRVPTTAEIARHLGVGEPEVAEARTAAGAQSARSLDAPAGDERGGGSVPTDRLLVEDPAFEAVLHHETLRPLIVALPARDRRILSLRFGAELTQAEIGRELGVTQMHVSRLLARILTGLRTALLVEE
ncbi:SigB/SigF/SigG family RNA polymerase sigma factor [Kitasatospora sp. NBC_01287]|uniref:SigB/SigF/SigG family RNA polymerase sigma factor n=1 Tax=Kitasatospora sp. NBC_01287 TaxID=2903573 RepID=UPI00224F45F0|nr:SigB/SigF/SigG family RNA polymerase sigma factor [Kitasatospora sp. NBC_01287]MCX4751502.1 SigB/SigF/SigG family RNA polymerase sigma factor [Kitasatospora sp. NBC_01287]